METARRHFLHGDTETAIAELRSLANAYPEEAEILYWLGNAQRKHGDTKAARESYIKVLQNDPTHVDATFGLAFLYRDQGRYVMAGNSLAALAGEHLDDHDLQLKIIGFLWQIDQAEHALGLCRYLVDMHPERGDLQIKLARLYRVVGRFDDALDACRKALDLDQDLGGAWVTLSHIQQFDTENDPDFLRISNAHRESLTKEARMCLAFAQGKALDDLQQWPEAFAAYQEGNELSHRLQPWDSRTWLKKIKSMRAPEQAGQQSAGQQRPSAIFIVGMLRSGTTLLEQRLDQHEKITGRGELNQLAHMVRRHPNLEALDGQQMSDLGEALWQHMRQDDDDQHLYIDKNPLNFRFLQPLIQMMPEAKIIHMRRDGRNSCLSCFFQLFRHPDVAFANDLDTLVSYYQCYRSIMASWHKAYPEQIYPVRYEDLIQDPQPTLMGVLEFLGLRWDARVMTESEDRRVIRTASVWQSRQTMYSRSLERWRHYYDQAPRFFDAVKIIDRQFDKAS